MSALSESISQRMTLGYLRTHYGLRLIPPSAEGVTVTSLSEDLASVRPGSLYLAHVRAGDGDPDWSKAQDASAASGPAGDGADAIDDDTESGAERPAGAGRSYTRTFEASDQDLVAQAEARGAYAVLLPEQAGGQDPAESDIPLLVGNLKPEQLGRILSNAAGDPTASLAVFVLVGHDVGEWARELARFLHTLGNPVGLIGANGSNSLARPLDMAAPLSMFDVQRALSICLEDGCAAVVIQADPASLEPQALQGVQVDVLAFPEASGSSDRGPSALAHFHEIRKGRALEAGRRYGFCVDGGTQVARRDEESDELARMTSADGDSKAVDRLSLNIAMTVAAGVKRSHIRSALEASRELS
ncbi:hypothetical protein [Bifidobacterium xylocopae]|nr:hypothetical protein [Bifidobacterium xylocopae]